MAETVLRTKDVAGANNFRNIFEFIQGRAAGVQVFSASDRPGYNVIIRGSSTITSPTGIAGGGGVLQPLYVLDGMALTDGDVLLSIPMMDVERVDVVKGAGASLYGSRGANGVIAVYTKRGPEDYADVPAAGVAVRQLPAYYRAREFYAPRYETSRRADKPDPRATTLYWQPRLTVPASGRARVSFYTADQAGTFRASVEGVSLAGQPATAEATLTVADQP